jgi:recombination protein RecA
MITQKIQIKEIKTLLESGVKVQIKTKNGKYTKVTHYIDKGVLDTYRVTLKNGFNIKVSKAHRFFTNAGWLECGDLKPEFHSILCVDNTYSFVTSVEHIGQYKIVDITVEDPEECYFGNGMLNHNSGKSLISAHIVANTQKMGGKAIYIDTENAAAPEFWKSLGVNLSKESLMYLQTETVEDIFATMEKAITYIRKDNPDMLLTIIVDSVAAASTKVELESDHGKDGYATGKAIIISKAMRKITNMIGRQKILIVFTNQLRVNINAAKFGDPYTVSGGKALGFHCSVRVRLSNISKIKKDNGDIIGNVCKAVVTKNRMGPPQRIANFNIYYDSGIADYSSWVDVLKKHELLKSAGSNGFKYTRDNGNEVVFSSREFVKLVTADESLKNELYQKICDKGIMQYQEPNSKIEENVQEVSEGEDTGENAEE